MHNAGFQQQGCAGRARALHCAGKETSMDFSLLALVEPNYTWSNKSLAIEFPLQTRSAGLPLSRSTFPSLYLLVSPSPPSLPLLFFFSPLVYIYCKFTFHSPSLLLSLSLFINLIECSLPFLLHNSPCDLHLSLSPPPPPPPITEPPLSHHHLIHAHVSVCPTSLLLLCYSRPLVSVLFSDSRTYISVSALLPVLQYSIYSPIQQHADCISFFFLRQLRHLLEKAYLKAYTLLNLTDYSLKM